MRYNSRPENPIYRNAMQAKREQIEKREFKLLLALIKQLKTSTSVYENVP